MTDANKLHVVLPYNLGGLSRWRIFKYLVKTTNP